MPSQVNMGRTDSHMKSPVDTALVQRATEALLKHNQSVQDAKTNPSLLGDDQAIQVQIGLDRVPENPSPKPIRVEIPHTLYKLSEDSADEGLDEPSVCLIVKEESKQWVQDLLEQFPEQLKCVRKVLGLQSLRKKHARFQQRRELVRRFDVFMADDRILPMLAKALGKEFFHVKKQPIPIVLTRKEALPYSILKALQSTFLYISAGTSLTVRAGTTGMPLEKLVSNIQAVVRNAVPKIPHKWVNIRSIAIKTPSSMSLPIYNKTPEELFEISKMAGVEISKDSDKSSEKKEQPEVDEQRALEAQREKPKASKSPLLQALKKQKKLEGEEKMGKEGEAKRKKGENSDSTAKNGSKESDTKKRRKETTESEMATRTKNAKKTIKTMDLAKFISSEKFEGSRKGYVFRNGEEGVGYYIDIRPVVDEMAMEALKRMSSSGRVRSSSKKGRKGRR